MKKSFLFLVLSISLGSCKPDSNQTSTSQNSDINKTEVSSKGEGSPTDISTDVSAVDSTNVAISDNDRKINAVKDEESTKSEAPQKTKKRVKKKSFNPPHIAVLEQDEYEPYEEEIKEKPRKKEVLKKEVVAESKRKASNKVETPKVETKVLAPKVVSKPVLKSKTTEIVFRRNFFSFGDIVQGDTVRFNFDFTNIGEVPLIIEDAKGSCSCTHPKYPIIPIQPGESGKITGIYVSDDKEGPQNASVTLTANTDPSTHQLLLDGNVSISSDK